MTPHSMLAAPEDGRTPNPSPPAIAGYPTHQKPVAFGRGSTHSISHLVGVVAQLVERLVRNEKVAGSIPVGSTILRSEPRQSFRAKDGLYISIRLSHSGCPEPKSCTMAQSRSISPTSIACKGVSRSKAGLG